MKIVIIGNGMVGHRLVELLVKEPSDKKFEITVFSEESRSAYDRVHLSEYFNGKGKDDLALCSKSFYSENNIDIRLGEKIESLDRAAKMVVSTSGLRCHYDRLVFATGSNPFVPPIKGREQSHCFVYRTLDDLDLIANAAKESQKGVVIGGGLLGLEAAKALKDLGLRVDVVEFAPFLMATQLDSGGGTLLRNLIEEMEIRVHTEKNTQEILPGEIDRYQIRFEDGDRLETDMVVFSAGIRPRDELARASALEMGPRGGIVIDDQCRTSDPDIYAIGECALWNQQIFGLVGPGYQMAEVVAKQINKLNADFFGADMSTQLKLLGIEVASIGDAKSKTVGCLSYTWQDGSRKIYKKIVVNQDKTLLLGAVLVGDTSQYNQLHQVMINGIKLPEYPESLILPQSEDVESPFGIDTLPASAQICSCNNVTKETIVSAVLTGCHDISSVKQCTQAASSCGGCAPLVKQIVDNELEKLGMELDGSMCPHFSFTRQELYHIARSENIRTFNELISSHGKGLGCEICKPAVASILASCWNEHILKEEHASLQDTNDYFLANMQKNGTYSIVPRVPGGEITPDKLLTIGQVAKKFDLYTKITGAQRIDLFGAKVHELPLIWKQLIDAGFESGHAYGKALRTVKSCVGDSWCRFGVQDSVTMAIQIEERYRGIRAPHKIKMAVSGCVRECAEAQSKDVGVIATENGWNLYVCGNGGMKPRHADLFAVDLDDETLIRYIDRLLMFYIKTADRLQRTSVWLNQLEGGLDYLKKVVIDDHLNIAKELEKQMAFLVDSYACEWKKTLADKEKLQRFNQFVNSEEVDENIVFVRERGQRRPAKEHEKLKSIASV